LDDAVEYYEFRKDMYFFKLVSCFSVSLCGCPVIFDQKIEMFMPANCSLKFTGKFTTHKNMVPHALRTLAGKGVIKQSDHIESCCVMLANSTYESVKQFNDGSEIFEFFRHIRNASSHLNTFQFNHKEPSHPTAWRAARIEHQLKGTNNPLHGQRCFGYFLGVADILELLMDVERIIIKQQQQLLKN